MKSIGKRIMLSIFLSVVILAAITLVIVNTTMRQVLIDEITQKNQYFLMNQVKDLDRLFQVSEQTVTTISNLLTDELDFNRFSSDSAYAETFLEDKAALLLHQGDNDPSIMGIYTYFDPSLTGRIDNLWYYREAPGGVFVRDLTEGDLSEYTPENPDMLWFYGALDAGGLYWTPLYVDSDLGVAMISCTYPLYDGEQMIGIVGIDINFDIFSQLLKTMTFGETGFAAMVDADGIILYHPTIAQGDVLETVSGGLYRELAANMLQKKEGTFSYALDGQKHVITYTQSNNGKYFYIDVQEKELYQTLSALISKLTLLLSVGILAALGVATLLGRSIARSLTALTQAADQLALGNVEVQLPQVGNDELGSLVQAFRKMVGNIQNNAVVAQAIASGDLTKSAAVQSDRDVLGHQLNDMIGAIQALVADSQLLAEATTSGALQLRADASRHKGDFRQIIEGFNHSLDAIVTPLTLATESIERISVGDIPQVITMHYPGDYARLIQSLNVCATAITAMIDDVAELTQAAAKGDLSLRVDAMRHGGDFGKIIQGFNHTLDGVIQPVQIASTVLGQMADGHLDHRMEGRFNGDHASIQTALNGTLDTLSRYIGNITQYLNRISDGDLTEMVTLDYRGDFKAIQNALSSIATSLNAVLSEIHSAADQVASGSRQIAEQSEVLSEGASVQASAIEHLTAITRNLSEQIQQNAANASHADQVARDTKALALDANHRMQDMIASMDSIKGASTDISKIIHLIEDIAMQTNVLALNAAIEAARAGEHGRGFSVVADEVIKLASRSGEAAKKTRELVTYSLTQVDAGNQSTSEAAQALSTITRSIDHSVTLISDITNASKAQAQGLSQLNQSVTQISGVIRTNSSAAEETASASEELRDQAEELRELVARFKLR